MAIWFGHLLTFCQTYWSRARFGVVTTSNGLFRMYPSTGLCVKYDWYESITGLFVWNCAVLTFRLSVNCEVVVGNARIAFVERKPFTTALLPTNFENIVNFFLCMSKQQRSTNSNKLNREKITSQNFTILLQQIERLWIFFLSRIVSFSRFTLFPRRCITACRLLLAVSKSFAATYLSNYFFSLQEWKNVTEAVRLSFTFAVKRGKRKKTSHI